MKTFKYHAEKSKYSFHSSFFNQSLTLFGLGYLYFRAGGVTFARGRYFIITLVVLKVLTWNWDKVFKSGLSKFCGRQHLKVNKGFYTIAFLNFSSLFSKLSNQVWGILKSYWFNTKLLLPKFMKNCILAVYPYVFKPWLVVLH